MTNSWIKAVLVLHVLSALWLAAGAFGGAVVRAVGRRATDLAGKVTALRIAWRLISIFGLPGSVVAGLTGLTLLGPLGYGLRPGWVRIAVTLWILVLALNLFYSFPRLRHTLAAAEASLAAGAPSDEFKRLASAKAPRMLADLTALAVVVFVVLMVLRPY
jgi:uncharacterized membrane protein